ncbi:MAG: hypothetical protein ACRDRJ_10520 [Streptosporangiaceae bacterium]
MALWKQLKSSAFRPRAAFLASGSDAAAEVLTDAISRAGSTDPGKLNTAM